MTEYVYRDKDIDIRKYNLLNSSITMTVSRVISNVGRGKGIKI